MRAGHQVKRVLRHTYLALVTAAVLFVAANLLAYPTGWERVSVASAWLCMALMVSAVVIGPLRRLDNRPSPLNMYRRRDLGIWAALNGLVHFVAGNFVAMNDVYVSRFVREAEHLPAAPLREFLFSGSSILGLAIAALFLLLLALSSDFALHRIGAQRWKFLQKSALVAFWLSVLHGVAFQVLESRYMPMFMLVALALFLVGFRVRARSRA